MKEQNTQSNPEKIYSDSAIGHMSDAVAMNTIQNIYWMVRGHNNNTTNGEREAIDFIYGDGYVTTQLETHWGGRKTTGEATCTENNRVCSLVRAIENRDDDGEVEKPPVHCGCLGKRKDPVLTDEGFEQIFNIGESILKAEYDNPVDSFL